MNLLLRLINLLVIVALITFATGCATLNQSECQNANWEIIGLEDGSVGRAVSYIGEHREACAEYGISPNLESYTFGHNKGLVNYCTYQSGFSLGNQGRQFNTVCPDNLQRTFRDGYAAGRSQYQLKVEIQQIQNSIDAHWKQIEEIELQIHVKEELLVSNHTDRRTRRELLTEIRSLTDSSNAIRYEISMFEQTLDSLVEKYDSQNR